MIVNARLATLLALAGTLMISPAALAADGHAPVQAKPAVKKVVKTKPAAKKDVYVCPMHPEVTSTKATDKCPECGMFLEKKK